MLRIALHTTAGWRVRDLHYNRDLNRIIFKDSESTHKRGIEFPIVSAHARAQPGPRDPEKYICIREMQVPTGAAQFALRTYI